jgi:hypothetical protein
LLSFSIWTFNSLFNLAFYLIFLFWLLHISLFYRFLFFFWTTYIIFYSPFLFWLLFPFFLWIFISLFFFLFWIWNSFSIGLYSSFRLPTLFLYSLFHNRGNILDFFKKISKEQKNVKKKWKFEIQDSWKYVISTYIAGSRCFLPKRLKSMSCKPCCNIGIQTISSPSKFDFG